MRKKKFYLTIVALFFVLVSFSCKKEKTAGAESASKELVVTTYDSFNSEWGPGPDISKIFREKTGISIKWISNGDAGTVMSNLILEGSNSAADIILGIDQNMAPRILETNLLEAYRPTGAENIFPELVLDENFRLTPFDYSYFAFVYDSEKLPNPPASLEDLTNAEYNQKIILIDPRTSSVGLGLFGWIKNAYGSEWKNYWQKLQPSILTIAEGWSSAYGLFTRGEAPLVLSYTTSPGYHLEYEDTERYKAALFSDGHPLQIEAAGLLSSAKNKGNAKIFLDFMLTPDFQDIIPLTNWMYPVTPIPLPDSFRINPKSDKPLRPEPVPDSELNEWAVMMIRGN